MAVLHIGMSDTCDCHITIYMVQYHVTDNKTCFLITLCTTFPPLVTNIKCNGKYFSWTMKVLLSAMVNQEKGNLLASYSFLWIN